MTGVGQSETSEPTAAQVLLKAKNHWMDRALKAEAEAARLAKLLDREFTDWREWPDA